MFRKFLHVFVAISQALLSSAQNTTQFDWSSLEASNSLNWSPCYSAFECTRLNVPLDYSDPDGSKATIAVIRLPSPDSAGDPNYRGPIFFNPGVSGVNFLLQFAQQLEGIFNSTSARFDLVSFDPRGVGNTTPKVDLCFDPAAYDLSLYANNANSTTPMFQIPRLWAYAQVFGHFAKNWDSEKHILAHISTDNVARDMWQMVQAYNQTKLQYYGFSYGTLLGATFATLFPDKIERMILDAVVNATGWFRGELAQDLLTTDKGLQNFFDSCHAAGPTSCVFYESDPSKIGARLDNLLDSVYHRPIPVYPNSTSGTYGIVDYAAVRATILQALYAPYPGFSVLAESLAALENGDVSGIILDAGSGSATCSDNESVAPTAIECGDTLMEDQSMEDLIQFYQDNRYVSSFLNELMRHRTICSGWQVRREGRFTGPVGGNTSAPILFIGNTFDPVTPIAGAFESSMAFPGSVVLTQDSPGHTSFSAPSSCTINHIVQYFTNGTLPSNGTVCAVDQGPFNSTASNVKSFNIVPRDLSRSHKSLGRE